MARPIASLAPTGAQRMTQSALRDRLGQIVGDDVAEPERLGALQHSDRSSARTMRRAAWRWRAARAIDEPISPTPMIASSSKIGSASGGPSRSTTLASHELGQRRDDAPVGLLAADRQPQAVRQGRRPRPPEG